MVPKYIFDWLIDIEGGSKFTDDPDDRGGPTKYGISKNANPDIDVENLTKEKANNIYFRRYWLPAKCNALPDYMQLLQFNVSVHAGPVVASKVLQKTVGAEDDGKIGRMTLARVSAYGFRPKMFTINYASYLLLHYLKIIINFRNQEKWARGWFKRTASAIYDTAINYGVKK